MFQTIGTTITLVALVWAFGGQQSAHAFISMNGVGLNGGGENGGSGNGTNAGFSSFAIEGIELAPATR